MQTYTTWVVDTELLHTNKAAHRSLYRLMRVVVVRDGQCSISMGRYVSAWPEAVQFEECGIIIALPFLVLEKLLQG